MIFHLCPVYNSVNSGCSVRLAPPVLGGIRIESTSFRPTLVFIISYLTVSLQTCHNLIIALFILRHQGQAHPSQELHLWNANDIMVNHYIASTIKNEISTFSSGQNIYVTFQDILKWTIISRYSECFCAILHKWQSKDH